jgi:hypothetical protein
MKFGIVGHAVLVGICTGGHGGVAGIGDGRVDGLDSLDTRALGIKLLETGAGLEQIEDILIHHRVTGKYDYFAV